MDELGQPLSFDMLAASLRADAGDQHSFLQAFAYKMEQTLPQQTEVERHSALFSKVKHVQRVRVRLGEFEYTLEETGHGALVSRRAKAVRGIVLKNEELPLPTWIDELAHALADHAAVSEQNRIALENLLMRGD